MSRLKRVCVLASGGIDSSVLVADMLRQGYEVHPFYMRCGLYWERAELAWLRRLLRALAYPRLKALAVAEASLSGFWRGHWSLTGRKVPGASTPCDSVYLPGRNLLLLSYAGLFSHLRRIPLVAQAVLKGNPFADATPGFRRRMEGTIGAGLGSRIRIIAPYLRLSKSQVIARVKGFPLHLTFSCLSPRGLAHCGVCAKCEERRLCLEGAA